MAHDDHSAPPLAASRASISRRLSFSGELLGVFALPSLVSDVGYGEILAEYGQRALGRLDVGT
ncbi:MAG: hypothetical protein OXH20_09565 [bacterium]|nr:hypothetical protein [bacterium]MXZ29712.1 hypothetical protein [Acidimicrobiia bacterium]MYJ12721.1 hypothetical protein [Acidimicrobiia bacterium]